MSDFSYLEDLDLEGTIFTDDVEIDEIPDNPNHLPEDTYTCQITEASMGLTNKKDKVGLTIKYQIVEGAYSTAFPFTEWIQVPVKAPGQEEWTPEQIKMQSRIKKHYEAAGFGADEMKGIKPSMMIGRILKVTTKNKKDGDFERINIFSVSPLDDTGVSSEETSGGASPFSKAADDI